MPIKITTERVVETATFASAAILSRALVLNVETRLQMIGFIILAGCHEVFQSNRDNRRFDVKRFALNAALAALAIFAVRWQVEGLCPGHKVHRCLPGTTFSVRARPI